MKVKYTLNLNYGSMALMQIHSLILPRLLISKAIQVSWAETTTQITTVIYKKALNLAGKNSIPMRVLSTLPTTASWLERTCGQPKQKSRGSAKQYSDTSAYFKLLFCPNRWRRITPMKVMLQWTSARCSFHYLLWLWIYRRISSPIRSKLTSTSWLTRFPCWSPTSIDETFSSTHAITSLPTPGRTRRRYEPHYRYRGAHRVRSIDAPPHFESWLTNQSRFL